MNTEESPVPRGLTNEPPPKPRFHPVKIFVVLVALVALSLIAALIVRQGQATVTEPIEQPDYSLTDIEAITRFKELDTVRLQILRSRDLDLLDSAFTRDSPAADRLTRSVRKLRRNDVLDRSKEITEQLRVLRNGPSEIRVRQVVRLESSFVTEGGEDVTAGREAERRLITWTLHRVGAVWLLHDGLITEAEPVNEGASR